MQLDALYPYATESQRKILDALKQHPTRLAAAKALGIHHSTVNRLIPRLEAQAARQGYSPKHDMVRTVPDGYMVKGVSTLYDKEGNPSAQWVKSTIDRSRQIEILRAAAEAMAEELPRVEPTPKPEGSLDHLVNVYTLTDSHVGMRAWHQEGGKDWDLKIAEKVLVGCIEQTILSSPPASSSVIAQLGDFLHYDSAISAVTPMHGHALDADGRMPKMVEVAIRILRRVIDIALQHHEKVYLLLAEGNHDISSSVWLRAMFRALYENEPRIEVIQGELPYYVHQHGETMLAWHHGHMKRNSDLPLLFASQFPKIWGNTTKRYVHCGHRHHLDIKEHSGMTVHQHSTLAARDAYAARGGWMSEQEATAVTYHKKFGQVGTVTITPEMLEAV